METLSEKRKKNRRKIILIVVIADLILVAGGALCFFLLMKGPNTPEKVAQDIMDASVRKDWKMIIESTPNEVMELLFTTDAEILQKKGINSGEELRTWAMEHASEVPDPMNGKGIKNYKVGEVSAISPEEYIKLFLDGDTEDTFGKFLKEKDEVAVVKISYIMVDGEQEVDRTDSVLEYRDGRGWYPLTGVQVIYSMLQTIG